MRRRRSTESRVSHERWLVSYADFITLLFAFFTTLYAISTVDARKLNAVVESMQAAFASDPVATRADRTAGTGGVPARIALPVPPPTPGGTRRDANAAEVLSVRDVQARLGQRLERQIRGGAVDLEIDPRGLVISIREAGSFATGSAELSAVAEVLLAEIAATLTEVGNLVRVEGHTDDVPIHTERYRSNWELSTARATRVVAYLIEQGLSPERLSAAGYGEFHPRVANDSDPGRARNRRTDVVVLNPVTSEREEPGAAPPPRPERPGEQPSSSPAR